MIVNGSVPFMRRPTKGSPAMHVSPHAESDIDRGPLRAGDRIVACGEKKDAPGRQSRRGSVQLWRDLSGRERD
jgi:hypothetical protein